MSTKVDPKGEPMATPSVCTYVLNSKVKWIFFGHNIRISAISYFATDVTISFFLFILLKVMSIVYDLMDFL